MYKRMCVFAHLHVACVSVCVCPWRVCLCEEVSRPCHIIGSWFCPLPGRSLQDDDKPSVLASPPFHHHLLPQLFFLLTALPGVCNWFNVAWRLSAFPINKNVYLSWGKFGKYRKPQKRKEKSPLVPTARILAIAYNFPLWATTRAGGTQEKETLPSLPQGLWSLTPTG